MEDQEAVLLAYSNIMVLSKQVCKHMKLLMTTLLAVEPILFSPGGVT